MKTARLISILFLSILFLHTTAFAKEGTSELLLFFEEKELLIETTAKHKQKIKESPSAVAVITADDINKLPARNLAEILETVVGYDVYYNGNFRRANIAARGLLDTSNTKRTLSLVDGRPANRVGDGIFDAWFETPLNNIERIEIIRGPGSALYGPNAFSGVVNIITKSPKDKTSGEIAVTYGTGDAAGYDINLAKPIGALGLYLTASGLHFNDEGIWKENEEFDRDSIGIKLTYKALTLSGGYNINDKGLPQKGKYTERDFTAKNSAWFLNGDYNLKVSDSLNLDFHLYLNKSDNDLLYSDRVQSSANQNQLRDERRIGGEILADYQFLDRYRLLGGIEARQERFEYNLDLGADERHSINRAVFLQIEGRVIDNGIITIGARHDRHSVYGDHTSPRISFLYTPKDNARFRLAYSHAFRAPEFLELYGYRGTTQVGNENLKPEKTDSYEAGIGYTFSKYLDADIAAFYNDIDDIITFNSSISKYQNSSGGSTRGIEVELKSRPIKAALLFANWTYQETNNDTTDEEFAYTPKHKFNLGLTGEYGASTLTLLANYKGGRKDTFGNDLGGYTTFNGKYTYKFKKNIDLSLVARNILDKRYVTEGHNPIFTTGINARDYVYEGAHVWFEVKVSF